MNTINEKFEILKNNYEQFLDFYKVNYPLYHNSNLFVKDFQYCIKYFLLHKGYKINQRDLNTLSDLFAKFFEEKNIFIKVNSNTWRLNYPKFITGQNQSQEKAA
jgi:hypothetical protein